ncbi:MAG: SAM-dependent MidA family methyltransferase [Saprospiraceae bacterium]|jgi:SAM-dependent MidA family methyltransferase
MDSAHFEIEPDHLFSQSKIWQLNRDFYQKKGPSAFSEELVPHNLTSSSYVGRTYAELIFGFLKDLSSKGKVVDKVYILELGAGHGRLAFHILVHLERLILRTNIHLPPYCYILSDIAEDNLSFFQSHPQFKTYFKRGVLDLTYFDAIEGKDLYLRHSKKHIKPQELNQPIIAIANYFFDSIPSELFLVRNDEISTCSISLSMKSNPEQMDSEALIKNLEIKYKNAIVPIPEYTNPIINQILSEYKKQIKETYLFFPVMSMLCIDNVKNLSKNGLFLLSLDKGYHLIHDLENKPLPDVVTHGSFSIWVNYHALGSFCEQQGGKSIFPSYSTFNLELGALMFLENSHSYTETLGAYETFVNDFGADDFNTIKQLSFANVSRLTTQELLAHFRLSAYDSTYFILMLPRLKQVSGSITFNERTRILETIHKIWAMYFYIGEIFDLPYALGGLFYDLGYYDEALTYFKHSVSLHGHKADTYYNTALSHYQLRQDKLFYEILVEGKNAFPEYTLFQDLANLDLS